jgi:5,10-methenyltetrahydrofolate synthetase
MTNRSDQRQQLRARRRALNDSERLQRSETLCRQLSRQPLFRSSHKIAAYLPADGEIETQPLIELAWRLKKQVYLPVLAPFLDNRLWFARFEPDTRLVSNRYGIAEPELIHRQRIAPHALDIVLAPLVGYGRRFLRPQLYPPAEPETLAQATADRPRLRLSTHTTTPDPALGCSTHRSRHRLGLVSIPLIGVRHK